MLAIFYFIFLPSTFLLSFSECIYAVTGFPPPTLSTPLHCTGSSVSSPVTYPIRPSTVIFPLGLGNSKDSGISFILILFPLSPEFSLLAPVYSSSFQHVLARRGYRYGLAPDDHQSQPRHIPIGRPPRSLQEAQPRRQQVPHQVRMKLAAPPPFPSSHCDFHVIAC